jgi:hypothetical protein
VTALLAAVAAVLAATSSHPQLVKPLIWVTVAILLTLLIPWLWRRSKRLLTAWRERQFVEAESKRLREFVDRFSQFTNSNNARSFTAAIKAGLMNSPVEVDRLIPCDFMWMWLDCFKLTLEMRATSLPGSLIHCREFSFMLSSFNQTYAQRSQDQLARGTAPSFSQHGIDELELFRDAFNELLRDFEQWVKTMYTHPSLKNMSEELRGRIGPHPYNQLVKSFRIGMSAQGR